MMTSSNTKVIIVHCLQFRKEINSCLQPPISSHYHSTSQDKPLISCPDVHKTKIAKNWKVNWWSLKWTNISCCYWAKTMKISSFSASNNMNSENSSYLYKKTSPIFPNAIYAHRPKQRQGMVTEENSAKKDRRTSRQKTQTQCRSLPLPICTDSPPSNSITEAEKSVGVKHWNQTHIPL